MEPETCPYCHISLQGEEIKPEHRQHYGGKTHYSRLIGIYSRERDRTVEWLCPSCQKRWPRV